VPYILSDITKEFLMKKYKSELSLNQYLSDFFGDWCGRNIHPPRPGQDVKGLSQAHQVLRLEQRQLQLHCRFGQKVA
jgi:hypothetical protein